MKIIFLLLLLLLSFTSCHNQLKLVKVRSAHQKEVHQRTLNYEHEASSRIPVKSVTDDNAEVVDYEYSDLLTDSKVSNMEDNSETNIDVQSESAANNIEETVSEPQVQHPVQYEKNSTKQKSYASSFDFTDFCFFGMIFAFYAIWISLVISAVFVIWGVLPWFWVLIIPGGFALLSLLLVILYFLTGGGII